MIIQQRVYKIEFTNSKIFGAQGSFPCPRCGVDISPEDKTLETYNILEVHSKNKALNEVVILCNMCESIIHLVDFPLLNEFGSDEYVMSYMDVEDTKSL